MEAHQVLLHSFMWTWIFVFFLFSLCSGMDPPTLTLETRVFVAFAGEELNFNCTVLKPANLSIDYLTCFNPLNKQIFSCDIRETGISPQSFKFTLELKNMTSSGEYSCQYKTSKVYWYLRVTNKHPVFPSDSKMDSGMFYKKEIIIVGFFTGVLLVFSVVGSVYVFRGHWKEINTEHGDIGQKQNQNREENNEGEVEEDNVDVITAPSTSFYASLETRPRSIYDVLDHSAANREPGPSKANPKKKEPKETVVQSTQDQQEGVFECVYENF
ncbi:uncharacterized protein si:ch211-243a20.4 [Anoplopoma fimbria]|uniref:uncharacterized protein si:ch211-243a20.4 n=1 Tax=Anoplopoma fimbria TaxID=229290 RepID=UPI0023ED597A|nr:uncharacterized protein si:ch211-243a20.4 [Anoplopoma fimbria]